MQIIAVGNWEVESVSHLSKAVCLAQHHPNQELKSLHAAVIYLPNGDAEFVGYNRPKSHPLQAQFGRNKDSIFLHAEIDAIVKALRQDSVLNGGIMHVARIFKKDGAPAMSKPCIGCLTALAHFGFSKIYYTAGLKKS